MSTELQRYLLGRLGQASLVLWAAFTVSFMLLQALPGDALMIKYQDPNMGLSPEEIEEIRATYGADTPLLFQYFTSLGGFLTGNLGYSVHFGVPVVEQLAANLPSTLILSGLGFLAAAVLAAAIAFLSTLAPFRWLRNAIQSLPSLFVSVPVFWLGIMLIQVFSFQLKLIPVINPPEALGLVLPVATLAIPISAPLAQVLIRSIDDIRTQPFVAVARSRGGSNAWVLTHHVVRNAALPALTIAGVLLGELIGGAVVTETVFGRSGVGQLTQVAVNNQDAAVLQAVVVFAAAAFVVVNLAVDLLYPVLDPRLKRRTGGLT